MSYLGTDTFICKSCECEVFRFTTPEGFAEDLCFLCNWINTNPNLTEQERAELRERYRMKTKTHGS
jgi:hypothetical protein